MRELQRTCHFAHFDVASTEVALEPRKRFIETVEKVFRRATQSQEQREKERKTAAELQKIKKEQRAAKSLLILVGWFFLLWFWYEIIANFIMPICQTCVPRGLYDASYWPQYHIAGINPLIYAVTIERFRYHFLKVFSLFLPCCCQPCKGFRFSECRRNRIRVVPAPTVDMSAVQAVSHTHRTRL